MLTKVCGLTRREDIRACLRHTVDLVGFIFHPPSPRFVSPAQAGGLKSEPAKRVGVFVNWTPQKILDCMDRAGLDLAQLHGGQGPDVCRAIGPRRVIKVLWPQQYSGPGQMQEDLDCFAPVCSAFLLDSGRSGGGHGTALHLPWLPQLSFPRPWLLAGGLGVETLPGALAACTPDGVDLNSGVERAPGCKDEERIAACLELIRTLERT